jgi:ABC-type multidrug transport system ATPase subunit
MNNLLPLSVENLSLSIDHTFLFQELNFQLKPHQFVSVMGENGIGKTCLLEALLGIRKFQKGKVLFWGKSMQEIDRSAFYSKVGWVTSNVEAYPFGSKIFELFNFIKTVNPHWNDQLAQSLCDNFKLSSTKKLSDLSLGEHSKVKLIKAIALEPKLLLLDELTANLAPESKIAVLSVLMDVFSRTDMSVIYICHTKEEAIRLSDRVLELTANGLKENQ